MLRISLALYVCMLCIGPLFAEKAKRRLPQVRFNWKAGINAECPEKSTKFVDGEFFTQKEGFRLNGYVPCGSEKMTDCSSGVTVGVGVDLGVKTEDYFKGKLSPDNALDKIILDKIKPYYGLKDKAAADKLKELPLTLTDKEEIRLREVIIKASLNSSMTVYEKYRDKSATKKFEELPIGIRTTLFSFIFQHGSIFSTKGLSDEAKAVRKQIFSSIIANDFKKLSSGLRRLGEMFPDFRSKRRDEADLIDSLSLKCDRAFDIFFVVEESRSVGAKDFENMRALMIDFIQKFENKNTRVGIITYSEKPTIVHGLDFLTNADKIIEAIKKHEFVGGDTKTGHAMTTAIDLILKSKKDQPEGTPTLMFVLTDGASHDDVKVPAQRARDHKIIATAVGIGQLIKREELTEIAYDGAHIINFIEYDLLRCNTERLITESCTQTGVIDLGAPASFVLKPENQNYLSFELDKTEGLVVKIKKEKTNLPVKIFASIHDPNPDSIVQEVQNTGDNFYGEILTVTYKDENPALESSLRHEDEERALFDGDDDAFVSELSKEMALNLHESYDDPDFDLDSPQKTYPTEKYNAYLTFSALRDLPITFTIEASTCKIGEAGCINGSKEDETNKPRSNKLLIWILVLIFIAALAAIAYYLYNKRLRDLNNAEYIAA